jgi:hypothetical protein
LEYEGVKINMMVLEDPWMSSQFKGVFDNEDTYWESEVFRNQTPAGIDPRYSHEQGLFTVPISAVERSTCLKEIQVLHDRKSQGYRSSWFNAENVRSMKVHTYTVTIPENKGDLYFNLDQYTFCGDYETFWLIDDLKINSSTHIIPEANYTAK